jgi:hypothetical protein
MVAVNCRSKLAWAAEDAVDPACRLDPLGSASASRSNALRHGERPQCCR